MSRKTKKEKIASEQRRKTQIQYSVSDLRQENSNRFATNIQTTQSTSTAHLPRFTLQSDGFSTQGKMGVDYSYVLSDLRRILLLTALAFCAQLVLWYFLGNKIL